MFGICSPGCGRCRHRGLPGERQLVGIETLGTPDELRPLELPDDRLEAFDLAIAALDGSCHIAQQTLQKCWIGRQIAEVGQHGFQPASAGLQTRSGARQSMPSMSMASCAGVNVIVITCHTWPHEAALVEPLGEQTQPVAIPKQDIEQRRLLPRKANR